MPDSTRMATYDGATSPQARDRQAERVEVVAKMLREADRPQGFMRWDELPERSEMAPDRRHYRRIAAIATDALDAFDREHPAEPQGQESTAVPVEGRDGEDMREWRLRERKPHSTVVIEGHGQIEDRDVVVVVPKVTRDERDRELLAAAERESALARELGELRCASCDGSGSVGYDAGAPGTKMYEDCPTCEGSGLDEKGPLGRAEAAERQVETLRRVLDDIGLPLAHHPLWVSFKSRADAALASSEPKETGSALALIAAERQRQVNEGALIVAEVERLQRASEPKENEKSVVDAEMARLHDALIEINSDWSDWGEGEALARVLKIAAAALNGRPQYLLASEPKENTSE